MSVTELNISRKRGDTRRVVLRISDENGDVNIAGWTAFKLTLDTRQKPADDSSKVAQLTGVIVDAAKGRVGFSPTGTTAPKNYYFDAQGIDDNGEVATIAEGRFLITQDITK